MPRFLRSLWCLPSFGADVTAIEGLPVPHSRVDVEVAIDDTVRKFNCAYLEDSADPEGSWDSWDTGGENGGIQTVVRPHLVGDLLLDHPRPPLDAQAAMDNTISITTGIVPTAMLRPLPLQVWLLIIDVLGAEGEYDALEACAKASEGVLKERAKKYVPDKLTFRMQEEVASINLRPRWTGPKEVRILGGDRSGQIPHLATFAWRLAGKWTKIERLTIESAEWPAYDGYLRSLLLYLAYFKTISKLSLSGVTFPTVLTFWRFVCAFPRLDWLALGDVRFVETDIDARTFSAFRLPSATTSKLFLVILPKRSLAMHHAGQPEMILAQTLSFPQASPSPWSNITHLALMDVTLPTAANFGRLLCAFPALKSLSIEGLLMFSEHGFNPSDVPMLLKLTDVELDNNFSLWSDAQTAYRYLKKHPHMQLRAQLSYSVKVTHEDSSWIAPLLELLYQVTSCICVIHLIFYVTDEAYLARLWADLPSLDDALSQIAFDKLDYVYKL
ncbi:predicted protein [Postia placenta Mad-698-R]|nr:predicted protein [Postia placenta Mad-698-R]